MLALLPLRSFSYRSKGRQVIYRSLTTAEPWFASAITFTGLSGMIAVAHYEQVPGTPYLAAGLFATSVYHVFSVSRLSKQKATEITLDTETRRVEIKLRSGETLSLLSEELSISEEAPFPNDFKLLRKAQTAAGRVFYLSYNCDITPEGRALLKMP